MTLDKHERRWLSWAGIAVLILIALWLYSRRAAAQAAAAATPAGTAAATPDSQNIFFGTTPGIPSSSLTYNGQADPINSMATYLINAQNGSGYDTGYFPLFGLAAFGFAPGIS
jgi:hypothetical protein